MFYCPMSACTIGIYTEICMYVSVYIYIILLLCFIIVYYILYIYLLYILYSIVNIYIYYNYISFNCYIISYSSYIYIYICAFWRSPYVTKSVCRFYRHCWTLAGAGAAGGCAATWLLCSFGGWRQRSIDLLGSFMGVIWDLFVFLNL